MKEFDVERLKLNLINKETKTSWGSFFLDKEFPLNKNDVINLMFKREDIIIPFIITKNLTYNNKTLVIDITNKFKNNETIKEKTSRIVNPNNNEDFLSLIKNESLNYDCIVVNGFSFLLEKERVIESNNKSFLKNVIIELNSIRNSNSPSFIFLNSCVHRETYSINAPKIELPSEINYFYDMSSESYSIRSGRTFEGFSSFHVKNIGCLNKINVEVSASNSGLFLFENELMMFLNNSGMISSIGKYIKYKCPVKLITKQGISISYGDSITKIEFIELLTNYHNRCKILEIIELSSIF